MTDVLRLVGAYRGGFEHVSCAYGYDDAGALSHVRALMARATGDEKHEESSTSTLDALWVLYDRVLRVDPSEP